MRTEDAKVGDELVVSQFTNTATKGFTRAGGDPDCAICLKRGTEVEFDGKPATFIQVDLDHYHRHHDAIEVANGIHLITSFAVGTRCTVLQLPAVEPIARKISEASPLEGRHTMEDITA